MARTRSLSLLAGSMLLLVGCNGDAPTEEATPVQADQVVDVAVVAEDISYQPEGIEVPRGATVVVNFSNAGSLPHRFVTEDGEGTEVLEPDAAETVRIGPIDAPTVAFCTVDDHREQGMEFEFTLID